MKAYIEDIIIESKFNPRITLHQDTIQRYKDAYEIGESLPPLVIQKAEGILIDGFHRLEAQKLLGRTEVEAELLDIPEDQIYIEAVRRVGEHGLPPNDDDIDDQIFNLRVNHGLTFKEIGDLVHKHETTVSRRLNDNIRFKNLDIQDTEKFDRRTKEYEPKEILSRLEFGEKGIDIAEDLGISSCGTNQKIN